MKPTLLVLLVDALGWRLAGAHPGFAAMLPHRRELATILGFSSGALPTLFTGRMPQEHGRWLMYQRAGTAGSPFAGFDRLRWLPPRVRRSHRVTKALTRLVEARGVRGYFNLYEVPRERLGRFDLPEREDPFRPGGLPGDSLWDTLERADLMWRGWSWRTPEAQAFAECLEVLRAGTHDVLFVYTADLDARLHHEGSRGPGIGPLLAGYDAFLRAAGEAAAAGRRALTRVLCSDHGMVDVTRTVDVAATLAALGAREGRDYDLFLDSTFARFWWRTADARAVVRPALAALTGGRWLEPADLEREGCAFADHRYGDDLWLADPGVLVVPSYMGSRPLAAMHGYDPSHPDMTALLASDRPLPAAVTHLREVRGWLESLLPAGVPA
jgi:hypothetical protein